jgi:DNA helicase-2/ATP-dependent DNA helicase PcrA
MSSSHLAKLNTEQRYGVEYGGPNYADAGPLLIIAGAGSGKTNTLAHRVAHLILNGHGEDHLVAAEKAGEGNIGCF